LEGSGKAFEDKEYPNCFKCLLVEFGGTDLDHETEGLEEGVDALLYVALNKRNVMEFLHHISGFLHRFSGMEIKGGVPESLGIIGV
jgi:hypothetical protein